MYRQRFSSGGLQASSKVPLVLEAERARRVHARLPVAYDQGSADADSLVALTLVQVSQRLRWHYQPWLHLLHDIDSATDLHGSPV